MSASIRRAVLPVVGGLFSLSLVLLSADRSLRAGDPPAINPFGAQPPQRDDAIPGYVETSDGKIHPGRIYLTRDKRLVIYDEKLKRQREVPLRVVKQIDCTVKKEWIEKEWRFKELALDKKMYTGRNYPVREYLPTITLRDDRTITGPLSGIVYVKEGYTSSKPGAYRPHSKPQRYVLHKDCKGEIGKDLKSLVYIRRIKLGEEAHEEGKRKAGRYRPEAGKPKKRTGPLRSRTR